MIVDVVTFYVGRLICIFAHLLVLHLSEESARRLANCSALRVTQIDYCSQSAPIACRSNCRAVTEPSSVTKDVLMSRSDWGYGIDLALSTRI